jgi:hypothetical protein
VRHGIVIPEEEVLGSIVDEEETDYGSEDADDLTSDDVKDSEVAEWLKEWSKRETISGKVRKMMK